MLSREKLWTKAIAPCTPEHFVSAVNRIIRSTIIPCLEAFTSSPLPNSTIDLPSGVSSESEESTHHETNVLKSTEASVQYIFVAFRLPIVIVPVLSKSNVSISPAVSTALPDFVITLARKARSIPAIPIAESNPPIVVGTRQTNSAISDPTAIVAPL